MQQQQPYERYQRQILLNGFGPEGQQKLAQASVLVIGAGGLGCPALQYLAAAGVGKIGVVDDDAVALHNLHRQVIYTTNDVGLPKLVCAAKRLKEMNPLVDLSLYPVRLTNHNAWEILQSYNLVIDATDNFATRYVINDACVLLGKPLVYGAISQFEGQVAIFNGKGDGQRVNYRDLFPQPPAPGSVQNCAEAGVLGVLPGIIGTLQATEAIKLLTGMGRPLINQLFTYNALTNESYVFALTARAETATLLPATKEAFEKLNYDWLCGSGASDVEEIDGAALAQLIKQPSVLLIDVRENGEQPRVTAFAHQKLPLSLLKENIPSVEADTVVLFCQSGKRSREAARLFAIKFGQTKKILSLKGGLLNWKDHGKENT